MKISTIPSSFDISPPPSSDPSKINRQETRPKQSAKLRYLFGRERRPRVLAESSRGSNDTLLESAKRDRWVGTLISGAKSSLCKSQSSTFNIFWLEKRQKTIQSCQRRNCQIWNIQRHLCILFGGCFIISSKLPNTFAIRPIHPFCLKGLEGCTTSHPRKRHLHQSTCLSWFKQSCDCRHRFPCLFSYITSFLYFYGAFLNFGTMTRN